MVWKWTVIVFVGVALIGATLASAASISLGGADDLGSGSDTIDAPAGIVVTDVEWTLLPSDVSQVGKVEVTFAPNPGGDCLPGDGCRGFFTVKKGDGTPLGNLAINPFEISAAFTTTFTWTLNGLAFSAADTSTFHVTVTGPE